MSGNEKRELQELKARLRAPFEGATTSCPKCGNIWSIKNWVRGVPSDVLSVVSHICKDALAEIERLEGQLARYEKGK
jgi:hypothetical protein